MNNRRILTVILTVIPIVSYYLIRNFNIEYISLLSIENLVGIIAILSGITGIIMGISSARQANLDAVKEYFQQGDEENYTNARKDILEADQIKVDDPNVSKICNFFHLWGLLNRQKYLPIWVFDGSSGLQIVKIYMKLEPVIRIKREKNRFYAIEFEFLAYRIYQKYKSNFNDLNYDELKSTFEKFKENSKRLFNKRYDCNN